MKQTQLQKFALLNGAQNSLHPYFITGFSDGECCFSLDIKKNNQLKIG
jgi:hypothetical protein